MRYWQLIGNSLIVLGLLAFVSQPIIQVGVAGTYLYILSPYTSLILVVVGLLIRIDAAIRSV